TKEQNDLYHNESIISTSTLADDENYINDIETENKYLLKTLFSPCDKDLRLLSPILLSHENDSSAKIDQSNETTIDKPSGDN
ncbi:unnamed protein product, partial [Rotaria magnacalcarata]